MSMRCCMTVQTFFKRSMHTPLEPGEEFTDDVEFRDAVSRVVEKDEAWVIETSSSGNC